MRLPDLSGKVVLITGAGQGIGAETARLMARAGAQVIAAVKPDSGLETDATSAEFEGRLTVAECNVLRNEDVDRLFTATQVKYGRLDVLINNAGVIAPIAHIMDADADEWTTCLAVNAGGAFRCTSKFLPLLLAAKGLILNLSSGAAYRPLEGWSAYCASKAAVVMLSRVTALEYVDQGLRIFSLGVGPTDTGMQERIRASGLNPVSQIPREKLLKPAAIASVLAWLCGPEARLLKELEIDVRDPLFTYLLTQSDREK